MSIQRQSMKTIREATWATQSLLALCCPRYMIEFLYDKTLLRAPENINKATDFINNVSASCRPLVLASKLRFISLDPVREVRHIRWSSKMANSKVFLFRCFSVPCAHIVYPWVPFLTCNLDRLVSRNLWCLVTRSFYAESIDLTKRLRLRS